MNATVTRPVVVLMALACALPAQDPVAPGRTGVLDEEAFKALHDLKGGKAPPAKGTMIDLADGSKAYLALPVNGQAPLPALVVIHEWWGLNEHVKHWADRLAEDGYAALAVDLYRGKVATTREEAMAAMRAVEEDAARKSLLAAHEFLAKDERVKAKKRGSIGWCFGGAQSLSLAMAAPDLDACVLYYGTPVTEVERLKAIKAPVCGVFGNADRAIPPALVDRFEAALKEAGVRHEIWRYDADHAFANPSGARYDAKSAAEAWSKVRSFLERNLGKR
jgi:carboxymethylenebutenolidase